MMRIELLTFKHLANLDLQPEQADRAGEFKSVDFYKALTSSALPSYAAVKRGEVLGCYGTQLLWTGRGMVWALLSRNAGHYMREIHSIAAGYLVGLNLNRIEAYVRSGFGPGIRWVRMLGFEHEGHMPKFFADGEDAEMYARIK